MMIIPNFKEIQFSPVSQALLLPEKLVEVVLEVPDPELPQPGVLDGSDTHDHLAVKEEL